MSDTKHTPEPWKITDPDQNGLYGVWSFDGRHCIAEGLYLEDARRIVACVNACKLYTNDELEYGMIEKEREAVMAWERAMMAAIGEDGIKSVTEAIAKLKAERDKLLAAMYYIARIYS